LVKVQIHRVKRIDICQNTTFQGSWEKNLDRVITEIYEDNMNIHLSSSYSR